MANVKNHGARVADEASGLANVASKAAESAYEAGKRALDTADEKLDELSRFGRERPLMAMGIAFAAGYLLAKVFGRR